MHNFFEMDKTIKITKLQFTVKLKKYVVKWKRMSFVCTRYCHTNLK